MSSAAARKTFIAQNAVAAAVTFIDVKPFDLRQNKAGIDTGIGN